MFDPRSTLLLIVTQGRRMVEWWARQWVVTTALMLGQYRGDR